GGSGRIGIYYRPSTTYAYQLTDHLGNVRAVVAKNGTTLQVRLYNDYYPYGMVITPQTTGTNDYRYGYQGQYAEKDPETDWNAFELRMYDAKIARWLSVDPKGQFHSPYVSMGNNPITGVDPDGGFSSWLRAFGYWLSHEGGKISKNEYGEWSVRRANVEVNAAGETIVTSYLEYGEGRHSRSASFESLANDQAMMADIQVNGEKSLFKMYDSPTDAGWSAMSIGTGLGLSAMAPALKGGATGANAAKGGSQLLLKPGAANLTQKGLDHIVARHWFTSGAKGAGKFAEGTTGAGLKSMINTTTTQGAFRANTMGRAGTIAEYNFGRVIGTTSSGAPASSLRVVIGTNGNVITAFPF
ncbi:MAG TPA: RHS repeat-associated core domain-containing protein, partial [Flavipsychrobacter sp.]|uniref:RHS repeat-associated core domain-containing protein n=1 Tax=Agriterribacter sp. TaxID=2821509 RepID=UPI002BCB1BFA